MRCTQTENILHEYEGGRKGAFRLLASHHQRATMLIDENFMHVSLICSQSCAFTLWLARWSKQIWIWWLCSFFSLFRKKEFVPSGSGVTAGPGLKCDLPALAWLLSCPARIELHTKSNDPEVTLVILLFQYKSLLLSPVCEQILQYTPLFVQLKIFMIT